MITSAWLKRTFALAFLSALTSAVLGTLGCETAETKATAPAVATPEAAKTEPAKPEMSKADQDGIALQDAFKMAVKTFCREQYQPCQTKQCAACHAGCITLFNEYRARQTKALDEHRFKFETDKGDAALAGKYFSDYAKLFCEINAKDLAVAEAACGESLLNDLEVTSIAKMRATKENKGDACARIK